MQNNNGIFLLVHSLGQGLLVVVLAGILVTTKNVASTRSKGNNGSVASSRSLLVYCLKSSLHALIIASHRIKRTSFNNSIGIMIIRGYSDLRNVRHVYNVNIYFCEQCHWCKDG